MKFRLPFFGGGAQSAGYDGAESSRFRKDLGWGRATERDEDRLIGDLDRERLRLKGADMRRNDPIVAGVCDRLAGWVVGTGIQPQAHTSSEAWNEEAEAFWRDDFSMRCDSRGRLTLWDLQQMAVGLRPTAGGLYLQLTQDGKVRPIETERIRSPKNAELRKLYTDGVRIDPVTGAVVDYRVHARSEDGTFSNASDGVAVPAAEMLPVINPPWRPDMVREVPMLSSVLTLLADIGELNKYTLNTAKVQSMIIAFQKKIGGVGANSMGRGATATTGKRNTWATDWGQILEGFPGEDLDMKSSVTPNQTHIPYVKMQLMLFGSACDLPYEWLTLDFSTADFSRQKAIMMLVNKTMRRWRQWLNQSMNQKLWNWRIAMAIRDGVLPPAPVSKVRGFMVSEWSRVEWQGNEEAWTDRQEANQADMMEWQLGIGPLSNAAKRRGSNLRELLTQKARDLKMAEEIEIEYGLQPDKLIKAQIPGQTETPTKANAPAADDAPKQNGGAE